MFALSRSARDLIVWKSSLKTATPSRPVLTTGSVRYHYEEQHSGAEPVVSTGRLGVAVFKDDFQTIRSLAERDNANIDHWSEFPRGGHFAAMEVPADVVADLRVFFG